MKAWLSIVALAVPLTGCAGQMTDRASRVRMAEADAVKECQFLGQVTGTSTLTGVARHSGYQNAINELLDEAAGRGASHVLLSRDNRPAYWTFAQNVRGEAYRCKQ